MANSLFRCPAFIIRHRAVHKRHPQRWSWFLICKYQAGKNGPSQMRRPDDGREIGLNAERGGTETRVTDVASNAGFIIAVCFSVIG